MLGSPRSDVTVLHYAEHLANIPDKRIARYRTPIRGDGRTEWIDVEELDSSAGIADFGIFDYFTPIVSGYLSTGNGRSAKVGAADSYLLDAAGLVRHAVEWMQRHYRGPLPGISPGGYWRCRADGVSCYPFQPHAMRPDPRIRSWRPDDDRPSNPSRRWSILSCVLLLAGAARSAPRNARPRPARVLKMTGPEAALRPGEPCRARWSSRRRHRGHRRRRAMGRQPRPHRRPHGEGPQR